MIAINSCKTTFCFSRMVHRLTLQSRRRTGWSTIVLNLSIRTNGRRTHQISIHWISLSGELCWTSMTSTRRSQRHSRTEDRAATDLGQPVTRVHPEDSSCVQERVQACVRSDGGHFEHLLS